MTRRAPLPGASELFRTTGRPAPGGPGSDARSQRDQAREHPSALSSEQVSEPGRVGRSGSESVREPELVHPGSDPGRDQSASAAATTARPSGRRKHDAKITVYISGDELLALEQTRLSLRAEHDFSVDRGRIVREAIAVLLADLEANGEESTLVRRLRQENEG